MMRLEVSGFPALFVETTGPVRAGLMFRVGRADESLPLSGITHLVEHLALHRHGLMDHHANASVSDTVTHFYTMGTGAEVVAFFDLLCQSLVELPADRLAVEKEILQTEAAGRGKGVNAGLPLWRYGAQGYGLVSYPEFGLHRVTMDDLRGWSTAYFARGNAVLWVAGDEMPAGLRLSLPDGTRRPCPPPTSVLESTPAYFHVPADGVAMDTVVPRAVAGRLFAAVLERALYRNLRLEGGVSYTVAVDYSPRGDSMAVITAYVDALPENRPRHSPASSTRSSSSLLPPSPRTSSGRSGTRRWRRSTIPTPSSAGSPAPPLIWSPGNRCSPPPSWPKHCDRYRPRTSRRSPRRRTPTRW